MISESSKETVPEFYLTSFLPINAIRDLYFLKNCVYVLLSIKQIKNVKNISFVILFTDIVHQILCGIFVLTAVTATMSTCCNTVFFYMNNSLSKDFLSKVCICNVQTWANQLVQRVVLYIRDSTTHYGWPSSTLKGQRGLLPEISNPVLVDVFDKSVAGQHFLMEEVIQFWSHPLSLLFPYIWNTSSYPVILHK